MRRCFSSTLVLVLAACGGSDSGPPLTSPSGAAGAPTAATSGIGGAPSAAGTGGAAGSGAAAGASSAGSGGATTTGGAAGMRAGSAAPAETAGAPAVNAAGMGGTAGAGTTAPEPGAMPGSGPAETKPLGYGQATTGGGRATPVRVATLEALQAAIDAYSGSGGLVLEYTGRFDFETIPDPCVQHTLPARKVEIKEKSDITLLGADGSAANFGIHIKSASRNIVIRNMTIGLLPGGGDSDMLSLEGMSGGFPSDIWIDHNELFSSLKDCPGAGDTAFDGMIDLKKGVDNVTVSYNYLHDHHKASLNGFSDDDEAVRHITYHHNVFENIGSRTPLQRHGYSHLLNNHLSKVTTSGINVRMKGYALIEANYFEDVKNPVTSRDSPSVGYWELRGNNLASASDVAAGNRFGITWDDGNEGTLNATDWKTTAAFPKPLGYAYEAQPSACVGAGLRAVVGAGKGLATLSCQ